MSLQIVEKSSFYLLFFLEHLRRINTWKIDTASPELYKDDVNIVT